MNIFERQAQLQKELYEIGTNTFKQLSELDTERGSQYQDLNQTFSEKLPEFGDVAAWTEIQREYGEAVWTGYQDYMSARGEIIKDALTQSNELYQAAFAPEKEAVEKAVKKPVRKPVKKAA